MDCKIIGDGSYYYAIQMDCKRKIPFSFFLRAIEKSKKPLSKICQIISKTPQENKYLFTTVDKDKIGYIIGKNGSMKKNICYHIPTKLAINENGKILVHSEDVKMIEFLLNFYGRKLQQKMTIAFFASEDFEGKTIKTSIGIVNTTKKVVGKKNDIIIAVIKETNDLKVTIKKILYLSDKHTLLLRQF